MDTKNNTSLLQNLFKLIKLAYRNLFRNKMRTLTAIVITASGCAAMSVAIGYYAFSIDSLKEMTIRNGYTGSGGSSHLQITDARLNIEQEKETLEYGIENSESIMAEIKKNSDIDYVMPRISFGGLLSNGNNTFPFMGTGIYYEEEARLRGGLSEIDPDLIRIGEEIRPFKSTQNSVLLGTILAKSLNAKVGDILLLYSTTVSGAVNAVDVEVAGIMSTGMNESDKYYLLGNIGMVQELLATDKVSNICVMLKDIENFEQKKEHLEQKLLSITALQKLKLYSWEEYGEFYKAIKDLFNIMFSFMGIIIIVIILLSCWNIMNMTTMERIKEIGTLRAIGLSIKNISTIFLLEAFLIGLIGVLLGLIVQFFISYIINTLQIIMPPSPGMNQGYKLQVYSFTSYQPIIAFGMLIVITLSSISSFFLIRKYSITEALGHK